MVLVAADAGVIAGAFLAFLLFYTLAVIIHYVIEVPLNSISIAGIHPFSGLASLAASAAGEVQSWAEASWGAVGDALGAMQNGAVDIWGNVRTFADAAVGRMEGIVRSDIPAATSYARDAAIGWAQGAISQLQGWASGAISEAITLAAQDASQAQAAAINYADGAVSEAIQLAIQGENTVLTEAVNYADSIGRVAADNLVSAEQVIAGEIGALSGEIAGLANREAADIAGVITDVRGLAGTLGDDVRALGGEIDANKAIAAAATGAVAATLTNWLTECGDPLCNDLSGFGRDIATLVSAVELGGLFAFLAYAIRSPDAAAHDALGPLTDIVHAGQALYSQVV